MKQRIGIVGVGRMGLAMARHLYDNGYPITVYDSNAENAAKALEFGEAARVVDDPAALGRETDFVIVAVGYDEQVNDVVLSERGLLAAMGEGGTIAISATVAPDTVRDLAARAQTHGIDILDAPICRGRWFADRGELLALMGARAEVVERSRPIFESFCSDIVHLGEVGHGQVGKAINNLLLWINSVGLIEAGYLAESTGIDLPKLRSALMMSSAKSQALEDWEQISFTWALKDMHIVSGISDHAELSLPITGAVHELVKEARRIKRDNPPRWTTRFSQ